MSRLLLASLRRSSSLMRPAAYSSSYLRQLIPSPFEQSNNKPFNNVLAESYAFSSSYPPLHRRGFTSGPSNGEKGDAFVDTEELVNAVLNEGKLGGFAGQDSILPIRVIISMIDWLHSVTGLPWWAIIISSTLAMRLMMFPFIVLQQKKVKSIREILPQLPSPIPPPSSGTSKYSQLSLFLKEKRASGCPSFLWGVAPFFVQVPLFFFMLMSVRRMCLEHHHGFDCGGALWFQNLTYYSNDVYGLILPFTIAVLHYTVVQVAFDKEHLQSVKGLFGLALKGYKYYLNLVTIPILFIAMYIPQGSQLYWATNNSLTIIQSLLLKNKTVRMKLGLSDKAPIIETTIPPAIENPSNSQEQSIRISAEKLSPKQLYKLALQILPTGNRGAAISLLQQAIEKDPNHVEAMILMGQALIQEGFPAPAAKLLEHAAAKIQANDPEDRSHLILAYSWAGVAHMKQGNKSEGIEQLRKVAGFVEPDEKQTKLHYFDSLVMLAAALHDEGKQDEAAKYLDLAAAYNSEYGNLFEKSIDSESDLVTALVNSRRRDY